MYLWSPKRSPTLRLDIILQLQPQTLPASGETPFGQIDALYRHILLSCDDVELALRIIGVCLVSTGITDIDSLISHYPALTKPEYIEAVLCIHPGDVQRGLEDLGSLVEYKGDEEELRVLHASLFDFLLDPSRCYGLPFDLTAVHTDLALWYSQFDSHCEPMANPWNSETAVAFLCASTVGANPTVELEESLRRMTLPDPTLPLSRPEDITSLYPYFIGFLRNSTFKKKNAIYDHHLRLYEQHLERLLQFYAQHCPIASTLLALLCIGQELNWSYDIDFQSDSVVCQLLPICHPQLESEEWDLDGPDADGIRMVQGLLFSGLHPTLASILDTWVPKICCKTALSCLRYLCFGGHSIETRKSLDPLWKAGYLRRLKIRPWRSRVQRRLGSRLYEHWVCYQDLYVWWDRQMVLHRVAKICPEGHIGNGSTNQKVPTRFFRYRTEYANNYDLWYTYPYALKNLPLFLAKAPPDAQLATCAAECVFNSFSTAYPRETRKAKKAVTRYLSQCQPIETVALWTEANDH